MVRERSGKERWKEMAITQDCYQLKSLGTATAVFTIVRAIWVFNDGGQDISYPLKLFWALLIYILCTVMWESLCDVWSPLPCAYKKTVDSNLQTRNSNNVNSPPELKLNNSYPSTFHKAEQTFLHILISLLKLSL